MSVRKTGVRGLRYRGKVIHIQKRVRLGVGKTVLLQESTGTSDVAEAEDYLAKRIAEERSKFLYGERSEISFKEAAKKYLAENQHLRSIDRISIALDHLVPVIGHLKLDEIHDESLRPYVHLRRQRVSVGTVKKEIGVVRRILNLAWSTWSTADGYPYVRRVRALTMPKGETRRPWPISQYEEARLLRELPTHLAEIAVFMLNTGIRTGELLNLQWEWERKIEDTSLSVFVLPEEFVKSGKARIVILNSIAQRILESNRDNQSTHVFTYRGKPWKGAKLTNSAWKSARKRAGLQHVRVHDLRHTYGARLRAAGVSHEDRQDLLGHESGSMTTHYSAASIQRLQSEAEKVIGSDPLLLDRQASWMGQKRGSSALVVGSAG